MKECLEKNDIPGHVIGDGPLAQVLFTKKLVYNYREQKLQENAARRRAMMVGLFKRGVFLNPMGTKLYLSLKHTEEVCDQFVEIFNQTLQEIKQMGKSTTTN
ncbi:uncharacterized protein [Branchiostoma lanceolatum]|uniref:uncharacterized protein n=1 Tax=Branchiostoma lanceolatum TaxID=7740 RepID=UPI0034553E15